MNILDSLNVSQYRIAITIAGMMLLFTNISVWGQQNVGSIQKGYVKTKGRMVDGKHVKGIGLKGAVVVLQGRTDVGVQNNDGSFSFLAVGDNYTIQSVKKNGYQLVDADAVPKIYDYSSNPIFLVMETPEQQIEDLLEAEEKISKTLREQLKKARQKIQQLKEENRITEEDYRQQIARLMEDQRNNQKLITDMAKEYAKMDYDQMDELNRRISQAILNGYLVEADSLLRSKGDINSRIVKNKKKRIAEVEEEKDLSHRQHELNKSKVGTKKEFEDIASDCYKYYERFKLENLHDSAAHYIELRAELDTTNADWQFDTAYYLHYQHKYKKAEDYYFKASGLYLKQANGLRAVHAITNLANMLFESHNYESGENMYKLALDVYDEKQKLNGKNAEFEIIKTLYGLGSLYCKTNRYSEGSELFKKALRIIDALPSYEQDKYAVDRSSILDNIATQLQSQVYTNFEESERLYKTALDIRKKLAQNNPQIREYQHNLAITLNNLAGLYLKMSRFCESKTMYYEALSIREGLVKEDSIAYAPDLAEIYYNLGVLYYNMEEYTKSKSNLVDALNIYTRLATSQPMVYSVELSSVINSIAKLSYATNRLSDCELLLKWDVELLKELIKRNQKAYEILYVENLSMLAAIYVINGKYQESEGMLDEATAIYRSLTISRQDIKDDYVTCLSMLSSVCLYLQKFEKAEKLAKEALTLDPTQNYITSSLAAAILFQGNYSKAKKVYSQYKSELRDTFLGDLKQCEEAGIIPRERELDVKKIKELLIQ